MILIFRIFLATCAEMLLSQQAFICCIYCIQAFCDFVSLLLNTITLSHGGHTHWKCLKLSGAGQFHNSCFQLIGCVLIVFFGDGSVEASQLSAELANATNAIQESISMTWKFEFRLSASRRRMIRV